AGTSKRSTYATRRHRRPVNYKVLPVVTPEVRAVFDRLLASEQEIAEARRQQNMDPLFNAAEDAGMTDAEFASYRAAVDAARQEAEEAHAAEYMAELTRTQQAWWREEREQVRAEVEAETNAMPVYVALAALQGGTLPAGVKLPEGVQPVKLDRQAIVNAYGQDVLQQ